MKRSLARLLRGQKTVYIAAVIGFLLMTLSLSILLIEQRVSVAAFSLFLGAIFFIGISWFSHVVCTRWQLHLIKKNVSSADSQPIQPGFEIEQLSRKFAQAETSMEKRISAHAERQLNEYRTQAFNVLLSIQDIKDSTFEGQEPDNER